MVVLNNPNTGKLETLTQEQFNSYMAQTNGEAANWVVETKE